MKAAKLVMFFMIISQVCFSQVKIDLGGGVQEFNSSDSIRKELFYFEKIISPSRAYKNISINSKKARFYKWTIRFIGSKVYINNKLVGLPLPDKSDFLEIWYCYYNYKEKSYIVLISSVNHLNTFPIYSAIIFTKENYYIFPGKFNSPEPSWYQKTRNGYIFVEYCPTQCRIGESCYAVVKVLKESKKVTIVDSIKLLLVDRIGSLILPNSK